jgi:type II secretory pathway component PulJ
MVDFSDIVLALSAGASIAVVVTAVLVVLQLRQNSRLLEHAAREYQSNVALAVMAKITDESFPRRRKAMHDAARVLTEQGPAAFDDSIADLEARNFAFIYQFLATMAQSGVVDEDLVVRSLGRLVISDWIHFQPIAKRIAERYGHRHGTWSEFQWLAREAERYFAERERAAPAS